MPGSRFAPWLSLVLQARSDDKVPHHSRFSVNRLGRFRESDILRHIFEHLVAACIAAGLVKGEGFAVDASAMEANASRYHGKAPDESRLDGCAAPEACGGGLQHGLLPRIFEPQKT